MDAYEIYKEKIQAVKVLFVGNMDDETAEAFLKKVTKALEMELPEYEFFLEVAFLEGEEPEVEVETENGWVRDRILDNRINDILAEYGIY